MPTKGGKMSKKLLFIFTLIIIAVGGLWFIIDKPQNPEKRDKLTLAMDWTPNTNHTGIYVAKALGYYDAENINLQILPYSSSVSADTLVGSQKADLGISFTESILASSASDTPVVSIAAILPTNTSSIAVRDGSGIKSLKDLDGKTYGGYGAAYEDAVMKTAIKNTGGKGEFKTVVIDTELLDALKNKQVDFVWIYDGWQKVQARQEGFDIKTFPIKNAGIPDYYTPNIISSDKTIKSKNELIKRFMKATSKGYDFAAKNPKKSTDILVDQAGKEILPDKKLVQSSQEYLSKIYSNSKNPWGFQEDSFWVNYPKLMIKNKAILDADGQPIKSIDYKSLYTNQLLP
jgi:ABC-type nitrate/sulfonate/bicarbonate transport system substrate-binding protein